jgi:hypothetical protein
MPLNRFTPEHLQDLAAAAPNAEVGTALRQAAEDATLRAAVQSLYYELVNTDESDRTLADRINALLHPGERHAP